MASTAGIGVFARRHGYAAGRIGTGPIDPKDCTGDEGNRLTKQKRWLRRLGFRCQWRVHLPPSSICGRPATKAVNLRQRPRAIRCNQIRSASLHWRHGRTDAEVEDLATDDEQSTNRSDRRVGKCFERQDKAEREKKIKGP